MLTAAAVVASCAKENEIPAEENATVSGLIFSSEKPEFADETKTAWTGTSIQWSKEDGIRVAYTCDDVWQNADGTATADEASGKKTAKMYQSNALPADAETAQFNVPTDFKGTSSGTYQFYAIYPDTCVPLDFKYAPSASVTVPAVQTPAADSFDSSADIMVGKSVQTYTGLPAESVSILWNRLVAHTQFTFKAINGFTEGETVKSISLTANSDADMVGLHYVDVLTESVTKPNANTAANVLTISGDNLAAVSAEGSYNIVAWASFLPCTVTSLDVVITTDKATYTREISGISLSFLQNARNTLTVNMGSAVREETSVTQLVADGIYVVAYDNYMMTVGTTTDKYRGYTALSTDKDSEGRILVDYDAAWEFAYDAANDTYSIKSMQEDLTNPYLKGSTSASDLTLVASGDKTAFTITESDGCYKIASGSSSRYIGYNKQSPRFAMYVGSTQQPVDISLCPARVPIQLAAPDVIVETADNSITVLWDAVENADSYSVTCSGKEVVNTSDTSAEFTGLEEGTYAITVTAVSNDSKFYRNSNPVSKTAVVGTPTLDTPVIKSFVQTSNGFSAEIESAVEYASSYDWELYGGSVATDNLVGTGNVSELKFSVDINENDFLITEFTEGTVYYLVVVAKAAGYKDASSTPANFTAGDTKYYVKVTATPSDWSGKYLVVYGGYAASSYSSKALGVSEVTVTDNGIESTTATDAYAVEVAAVSGSTGNYTLKLGTVFIGYDSSSNLSSAATLPTTSANKYYWTFTLQTAGTILIKNVNTNTRYIGGNSSSFSSSSKFKAYSTQNIGQYPQPTLYKLTE